MPQKHQATKFHKGRYRPDNNLRICGLCEFHLCALCVKYCLIKSQRMNFITNFISPLRDFPRRASITFAIVSCSTLAFAQKEMRTYYDEKKQHIQEIFCVSREDEQKYVGKYQRLPGP